MAVALHPDEEYVGIETDQDIFYRGRATLAGDGGEVAAFSAENVCRPVFRDEPWKASTVPGIPSFHGKSARYSACSADYVHHGYRKRAWYTRLRRTARTTS